MRDNLESSRIRRQVHYTIALAIAHDFWETSSVVCYSRTLLRNRLYQDVKCARLNRNEIHCNFGSG